MGQDYPHLKPAIEATREGIKAAFRGAPRTKARVTMNYYCSYCDERARGPLCERCSNRTNPYRVES